MLLAQAHNADENSTYPATLTLSFPAFGFPRLPSKLKNQPMAKLEGPRRYIVLAETNPNSEQRFGLRIRRSLYLLFPFSTLFAPYMDPLSQKPLIKAALATGCRLRPNLDHSMSQQAQIQEWHVPRLLLHLAAVSAGFCNTPGHNSSRFNRGSDKPYGPSENITNPAYRVAFAPSQSTHEFLPMCKSPFVCAG